MPSNTNPEMVYTAPGAVGVQFDHALTVPFVYEGETPAARVAVPQGERRKHIAICGFASSSRHRMPVTEPGWEIWGLNQLYRHIPRADRWFDIHLNWLEDNVPGTDHPKWLTEFPGPVYMSEPPDTLPTAIKYPLASMIEKFGDYFTSTVAFMVAFAIDQIDGMVESEAGDVCDGESSIDVLNRVKSLYGQHTIGIFGIDLIVGTEYEDQRACVEYLIGQAVSRGITVYLPPETALCKQRWRYGYERDLSGQLLGLKELEVRQAAIRERKVNLIAELNQLHGRKAERTDLTAIETVPEDVKALLAARQTVDDPRGHHVIAELQTLDGALQESELIHQVVQLRSRGGVIPLPTAST